MRTYQRWCGEREVQGMERKIIEKIIERQCNQPRPKPTDEEMVEARKEYAELFNKCMQETFNIKGVKGEKV